MNVAIGASLMAATMLWWLSLVLRMLAQRERRVRVSLFAVVASITCWGIGRQLAGEGLVSLFIGSLS